MVHFSADKRLLLNKLIGDCISFDLKPAEAVEYVRVELGEPLSYRSIARRKAKLLAEEKVQDWLNNFTRIGFVRLHKEQMEDLERMKRDYMKRYFEETIKRPRNENLILKIRDDIRQTMWMMSQFSLGSPVIAALKGQGQHIEDHENEPLQTGI
jgi:hypothetical protein